MSCPPGIFTVTGLFTSPSRTAALAAAQDDEPEACVSPAPRSQIRMKSSLGPVGTASCTFVRFGNKAWFSKAGPSAKSSSRDQDSPAGLKTTQWGLPTLTPVKVSDRPAASIGCWISSLARKCAGKCIRLERGPAHLDGRGARIAMPVHMQRNRDQPAFGLDGEVLFLRLAGRVKIAGKDPQAVAGFFRFTAVGIENAQTEVGFL